MSRASTLQEWAGELYERHAPRIAELVGVDAIPSISIHVARRGSGAAWTSGTRVYLAAPWFAEHPDDVGGCLHEFTHAIMQAPVYDRSTGWLVEGIADWVRDVMGFDAPWTFARREPTGALGGYQSTAHFLLWLEGRQPGIVRDLSRHLIRGTYDPIVFERLTGRSLADLVSTYDAEA